jgi:hypothetical protein
MARLPDKFAPRRFTDVPPAFDTSQVQSPFSQALQTAVALRDVVDEGMKSRGAEAGQKAVSRDEDGNLQVEEPGFLGRMLPEYGAARENAARAAYLAEAESDIRSNLAELRKRTPADAAAFNTAGMAFAREMRDKAQGGFGPELFQLATREVERTSRGIQAQAERAELQREEGALRASIAEKENSLLALARHGGTDTQDFLELSAAYRDQVGVLVNNPLFGFSEEEGAVRMRNLTSRARLEASSRDVMGVYATKGEAAALAHARAIANNPRLNLTEPQREEWVADQRQLINERESAQAKARSRAKRLTMRRIDDIKATLYAGNDASSLLNDPMLFAGLDDFETEAAQEEIVTAKVAGQAIKAMDGADPAQRAEIINRFPVEGEGAARNARIKSALEQRAAEVARRLDSDPAGHVAESSPDLASDLGQALQDGDEDAFGDAAADLLEEQARLGALNPRLLTKGQRRALAANIAGEEGDENRAQNAVDQITRLSSVAGAHFPRIMAELAEEDDFPAALFGVGMLEGKAHAQFLLAKAALEEPKILRENVGKLGTNATGKLRDDLAAATRPLVESLAASGASQTYIAKVTDSVEALASQMAVEQGKVGDAGRKAFKAMFGDYHFEGSYRVPASRNPDHVRLGIEEMTARLEADDFFVPRADSRMTPEAAGKAYVRAVKARGQWVTNADESGLILVDESGQPVMERPFNPGEPMQRFEVSFDQLEALGRGEQDARRRRRPFGNTPLPR